MSSRLVRRPTGRTFFRPVTSQVVELYEREREAEAKGMGILSQVGKAALEIGKVVIPEVVGIIGSAAGGYYGAKRGVAAAVPTAVAAGVAPIAGAAPTARPKRTYGYIDPYTGGFVEQKRRKYKKKKKAPRRRYTRKKKGMMDPDMLMQILMIKQLGGG